MNNTLQHGPLDEASALEGDAEFIGVDERENAAPGYVSRARNYRFRDRRARPRDGITLLPWMKTNGITPFTEVYGGFVYNKPDQGGQWIIIAADGGVWKTKPHAVATAVPCPVTLTRATFRKFIQAGGGIVLLRGLAADSLVLEDLTTGFITPPARNTWDVVFDATTNRVTLAAHNLVVGEALRFTALPTLPAAITAGQTYYVLTVTSPDTFTVSDAPGGTQTTWNTSPTDTTEYTARTEVLDGAETIPPGEEGVGTGNRLWLVTGKDDARPSDLGDFLRFPVLQQTFRINQGDSHTLVALHPFNEDTLIALKSGSVLKGTGIDDLETARGPLNVTQAYGAASPSVADQGADLYWLNNELRLTSLRLTELNKEQGTNLALSDALLQTFGRINPAYASRARLTLFDGFLRVALPLDAAQLLDATELVAAGTYVNTATPVVVTVTAGLTYKWEQGAHDGRLVNGTEILFGPATFTAQGGTVSLYLDAASANGSSVTASVVRVLAEGVNTGIAVYDTQLQTWAGTDENPGVVCVVDWLKFTYGSQERLAFLGADGWLHLCDEGFEDEKLQAIATPYVDVWQDRADLLGGGDTIQINGGTVLAAGTASAWTGPNVTVTAIPTGQRFIATNGVLPVIQINGATVVDGASDWAWVDSHSGNEIFSVAFTQYLLTRRYRTQADMKRFTALGLQLATWSPSYTLKTVTQGEGTLRGAAENAGVTRNRLQYYTHGVADWNPTNDGEDYHNPGREDYSYAMTEAGVLLGDEGVNFDAHQEVVHRVPLSERGLWMQVEMTNADGRVELVASGMESQKGEVLSGMSAV